MLGTGTFYVSHLLDFITEMQRKHHGKIIIEKAINRKPSKRLTITSLPDKPWHEFAMKYLFIDLLREYGGHVSITVYGASGQFVTTKDMRIIPDPVRSVTEMLTMLNDSLREDGDSYVLSILTKSEVVIMGSGSADFNKVIADLRITGGFVLFWVFNGTQKQPTPVELRICPDK